MNLKRSSSPPSKSSSLAPTTIAKPSSVGKYASASNLTKLCNPRSGSLMMKPSSSSDIKVPLNPKTKNLTSVCRKSSNPDSTTASRKSVVVNSSSSRDSNGFSHATRNSKPSSPVATRKIATSLINKNLTKKLPSDVVLTILDFMVEICSKVLSKDGTKIKYSQFIRKFYGRFAVDKSTRFLFRFMNINHDEISNLDLNIALIGIPVISSCDRKVRLSKESVNYLFNHPHMYANPLSENLYHIELPDFRKRLYNFVALLGESNCKKIQELDLSQCELDLDTVELAIRSFTNLSVLKGRTDIYYSPKWYCEAPIESSFTDSMAEAFEEGGKNLKVFVWSASDFSTIIHQHTPNIEVLYLGMYFGIDNIQLIVSIS
nr:unnamed protein product [Naegleria fowleri]